MRKVALVIALIALPLLAVKAQNVIAQFRFNDPQSLQAYLADQPEFCGFQTGHWTNTTLKNPSKTMERKLGIVHFGTFDNIYSNHNADVLARLQKAFPELSIVLVNSPKFSFPQQAYEVTKMMELVDNPLPVYTDEHFAMWDCNDVKSWPSTFFVAPGGKVIDVLKGALDYRMLEQQIPLVKRMLNLISPLDKQPFTGVKPSIHAKKPILKYPIAIEKNARQQLLFISDFAGNRIWMISPNGDVLDIIGTGEAGSNDGDWNAASFNGPWGLAWDEVAKVLYVADHKNHLIRKVDFVQKTVSTLLGTGGVSEPGREKGVGKSLALGFPTQIMLHGHQLYIALGADASIWLCDVRTEVAERFAGSGTIELQDGEALDAGVGLAMGMALDKTGVIFVSDAQNSAVRAIDNGQLDTRAGTGLFDFGMSDDKKEGISFQYPMGMCLYKEELYIADAFNHSIRKFDPFKIKSETVAGTGVAGYQNVTGRDGALFMPTDIVELEDKLYITDPGNHLIREYDPKSGTLRALTLHNYAKVARGMTEVINDLRDLDPIEIAPGNNLIKIKVELSDMYGFDISGYSNMAISSRNDTLFVRNDDMLNGEVLLDYQLENDAKTSDIVLDFNFYFKEKMRPEKQYYRGVSYILPVRRIEKKPGEQEIMISFDPDASPAASTNGTQQFME